MTSPLVSALTRDPKLCKRRRAGSTVIFFILVTLLLVGCGGSPASEQAPDFQVTRFDGADFVLSEQIGRSAVVLNFWYPTCPPCRAEMPAFESAWQRLNGEGVQFLGLFVPQGFDSEQDARDFVNELGLTYGFATDEGAKVALAYKLQYFPTTFFIDKTGRIFKEEISTLDEDSIVRIVREMTQG